MPTLYRVCKTKYAASAFDGEGARLFGGRWNSPGTSMVYTAGSRSLAILEILVHLNNDLLIPAFSCIEVNCPNDLVIDVNDIADLPPDWASSPPPEELKDIGDEWVSGSTSVVLAVPSAVVPSEFNYLINPAQEEFDRLEIKNPQVLALDPRLIK
jgi:RES domain-containing protein